MHCLGKSEPEAQMNQSGGTILCLYSSHSSPFEIFFLNKASPKVGQVIYLWGWTFHNYTSESSSLSHPLNAARKGETSLQEFFFKLYNSIRGTRANIKRLLLMLAMRLVL